MNNARQVVLATTTYAMDNNSWYPRAMDTTTPSWDQGTHYWFTLLPYYNDFKVLADPGRDNSNAAINAGNWVSIPASNFWLVGHQYLFYDPRLIPPGMVQRTRYDDVVVPAKSLLVNCISQHHAQWQPAFWRRDDMLMPPHRLYDPDGGLHNGTESFVFIDGHASFHSTEPIVDYFLATNLDHTYIYPPDVSSPAEAEWWTMPYYPDRYPFSTFESLP